MKRIEVEIEGLSPLMHHKLTEEQLFKLLGAKSEKKKAAEELTPRQIAEQHAYKDNDGCFIIPTQYIVGAIRHVAGDYKQRNSARKSLKTVIAGVVKTEDEFAPLTDADNNPIKTFEVDVRAARNHQKGAVAVCRPRFDRWKSRFRLAVDDTVVAPSVVKEMLDDAGKRSGIGSFRVSNNGPFGQFQVTEWKELT